MKNIGFFFIVFSAFPLVLNAQIKVEPPKSTAIATFYSEAPIGCKLFQNTPNPFNTQTEIRYFLPDDVKQASICIFDMQGALLKCYPADNSGSLVLYASELQPGMYIYSLIANRNEVDTKRMILTK